MAQTRQEIRAAWDKANLRRYGVMAHKEHEKHIIDYVESRKAKGEAASAIFKEGIEALIEKEKG